VTCLCLTRNRRDWLQKAIESYQKQTYLNRELLIIADGQDVSDLLPKSNSIRLIHVSGAPEIGTKRNFGCERALGEIICHWDDDDYSAPGRVRDQVSRLIETGKAVTGYCSMLFKQGAEQWLYKNRPPYAIGTSFCFYKSWWQAHRFPEKHVAEDEGFYIAARDHGQLVSVDAGDMMYATIHKDNTSPRDLKKTYWTRIA